MKIFMMPLQRIQQAIINGSTKKVKRGLKIKSIPKIISRIPSTRMLVFSFAKDISAKDEDTIRIIPLSSRAIPENLTRFT
jgi:hypothetical protein